MFELGFFIVKYIKVLPFEPSGLPDNDNNKFSFVYTSWHSSLDQSVLHSNLWSTLQMSSTVKLVLVKY